MEERNVFHKIGLIIGGLIGAFLSITIVKHIWIPIALAVICLYFASRFMKNKNKYIERAVAIQLSHILWILLGMILYSYLGLGVDSSLIIDIGVMLIGVIWLYFKPGLASILFLTAYQIGSGYINVEYFVEVVNSNVVESTLFSILAHITLRLTAIVFMFIGYKQIRQSKKKIKAENIENSEEQSNIKTKLKELEELRTENLITNDEYISKRSQIINRI